MTTETQPPDPAQQKLEDIEQYRMQMAGISTAAIGYWKEGDSIHPDYDTVALRDVARLYAKYDALYKAAAIPAPDPAPAKPFFAYDPENGIEWFETMQEAQAYAAESLREYRRSASFDGEWSGDVEAVKVGHVTHFVAEHGDDESGYDYRLVTAIPAPEGADWTDVRMELEASGRADLSAWVASKLAAPAPQAAPATVKDSLTAQSPAEGDAGLTDEQAEAIAAFYDVSPGTVHDIYALSKPKAASDTQPKGTPAGMVLVEGAAFHDGSVSLMRHDAVESFCARRGAERLYRLTAAQSPAPAQCTPALKRHALEAADRLAMYAAAPFFPDTEKRGVKRATTAEWWDGLAELIEEAQPLIKRGLHECTAPLADLQAPAVKADPLTEPGVQRLVEQYGPQSEDEEIGFRDGVRASERAHGIGEAQPPVQPMGDANG